MNEDPAVESMPAPDIVYWELEPGERPIWHGRPEVLPYIKETTRWGRALMGLPFVAVGSVLVPIAFPLGGLFVLVGCGMLGVPVWNWLKARNTLYVVTNSRLIIIEHVLRHNVMSYPADTIEHVERRESRDGSGSIVFSRTVTPVRWEVDYDHSMVEERGFFGIREVGPVWQIVMNLKNRLA